MCGEEQQCAKTGREDTHQHEQNIDLNCLDRKAIWMKIEELILETS
jgi:hypothetical protein